MASKSLHVITTLCLVLQIFVLSSLAEECLYKCQDFADNEMCITDDLLCNHFPDCMDGQDEEDCGCKGFTCKQGGLCIDSSKRCDGFANCFDRSDEMNCTKNDYRMRFPPLPDENLCKKPCGKHGSCFFASDEAAVCRCDVAYSGNFCEVEDTTATPPTIQAASSMNRTFLCDGVEISRNLFCDGKLDCADGTDEDNCTLADYRKLKPHLDTRFLCLKPCKHTACVFDNELVAICPCPNNAEGAFCEKLTQMTAQPPVTTSSPGRSVFPTITKLDEVTQIAVEESNNFFTAVALPVIGVAALAVALWLWIAKPWATGGTMGRPLVAATRVEI